MRTCPSTTHEDRIRLVMELRRVTKTSERSLSTWKLAMTAQSDIVETRSAVLLRAERAFWKLAHFLLSYADNDSKDSHIQ